MGKQTRRSISVSGDLYDALTELCNQTGDTKSGIVEREMRKYLGLGDELRRPKKDVEEQAPVKDEKSEDNDDVREVKDPKPEPVSGSAPPVARKGQGNVSFF